MVVVSRTVSSQSAVVSPIQSNPVGGGGGWRPNGLQSGCAAECGRRSCRCGSAIEADELGVAMGNCSGSRSAVEMRSRKKNITMEGGLW